MLLAGIATFAQLYAPQAVLTQVAASYRVGIASASLMVSMGTFGLAVSTLGWSLVADRLGRRRAISIAVVAASICGFVVLVMPTFETALAARLLEGVALGGVPAVAMAFINEEVHPRDSAAAVGTFVAGNTVGGLAGRIITGPVADIATWQTGYLVVLIVSMICALGFVVLTPQARGYVPDRSARLAAAIATTARNVRRHLRDPVLVALYLQPFLSMGGFVAVYNYLGHYLIHDPFGVPVGLAALIFLAYLAGTVASPTAGRLAGRYGRKRMLLVGYGIALASVALMLIAQVWMIVAALVIFTGAFFAVHSIASGWAGAHPRVGRAQSTGLYTVAYYVGSSIFGFVGGVAYQGFGWGALIGMIAALFAVAAIAAGLVLPRRPHGVTSHP